MHPNPTTIIKKRRRIKAKNNCFPGNNNIRPIRYNIIYKLIKWDSSNLLIFQSLF
jgi:hypothetical protein